MDSESGREETAASIYSRRVRRGPNGNVQVIMNLIASLSPRETPKTSSASQHVGRRLMQWQRDFYSSDKTEVTLEDLAAVLEYVQGNAAGARSRYYTLPNPDDKTKAVEWKVLIVALTLLLVVTVAVVSVLIGDLSLVLIGSLTVLAIVCGVGAFLLGTQRRRS